MKKVLYLFGQLTDTDVDWLAQISQKEQLQAGATLIEKGVDIDAVFIVLDGHLSVGVKKGTDIATLGSGEIVGEMSMVDARPPSATVTARDNTKVLRLPRVLVEAKLATDTGFAARFYRAISLAVTDRLRNTMSQIDPDGTEDDADELSVELLDTVHLAGARFNRLLQRLS